MHKLLKAFVDTIAEYLLGTISYSRRRFIVELALIAFPLKMLIMLPWVLMGLSYGSTTAVVDKGNTPLLFFLGVIAAPLAETLIGQWLPIRFLYYFTNNISTILIVSALFFAAQHLHVGVAGMIYTFPIAVLLSWSFLVYRQNSRWEAYWVTAAIHSLHNFITLLLYTMAKNASHPVS